MKSIKIGNVRLKNRLFLAPMVDVTDLPYRLLCRKYGAAIAYTEMLYVDAILHENKKTLDLMKTSNEDKPLGIQITGNKVKEFEKVAPYLGKDRGFDLVDINCGCPSIRITGNEAGSYLLKNPEKIGSMIRVLKDSGLTVTAKIRLGFKKNNAIKISRDIEKAGVELLTVHARLATQGRSVPADWKWIKKIKDNIGIAVVGNGDVFSGKDAAEILDICDGVMIARGAIGNPMVFRNVLHYLKTGKEKETSFRERVQGLKEYLRLAKKYDLEDMSRIKYLGSNFIKGGAGSAKLREGFMKLKSSEDVREFVKNF